MISVRQIHPLFAAEVTGVDLATLTPDQVAALQDASSRHAVLVFPGQSLNDDHLLSLGRLFGDVEPPRNHRVQQRLKHAELADISNLTATNELRAHDDQRRLDSLGNRLWHSDASFREVPGALSMLFAHIVPPARRRDRVRRSARRLGRARCRMKAKIEGLVCEHSIFHSRGQLGHTEYTDAERAALPPVRHPLVRIHPGSRRRTLYMGSHASHIVGWPMPDGRLLLRDLMEHATQREFVYRHEWRIGDLVMWDNRCTLHRGRAYDDATHPRDLRRVTTKDYYAAA